MTDDLISRLGKMQPTEDDWTAANRVVLDVIEAPPRKLAITSLVFYAYMCGVMQERARQKEKAAYGRGHVADGEAQDLPQKKSEQFQYIPPEVARKEAESPPNDMAKDLADFFGAPKPLQHNDARALHGKQCFVSTQHKRQCAGGPNTLNVKGGFNELGQHAR